MTAVVVGLGNLGLALARRLAQCDVTVIGIDLSPERRQEWVDAGGPEARGALSEVHWTSVDAVFVVVLLTEQAAAVLAEADRLCRPGTTCYVVTTLDATFATSLGSYGNVDVIELPVSGGAAGALAGDLTVMTAGPLTEERRVFVSATIAAHLVELDRYGDPTLVKLVNNVVSAYNAAALADMLLLAQRRGVDPARTYEAIRTATGRSFAADFFTGLLEDLLEKDIELLRATVGELPVINLADDFAGRLATARALLAGGVS